MTVRSGFVHDPPERGPSSETTGMDWRLAVQLSLLLDKPTGTSVIIRSSAQ